METNELTTYTDLGSPFKIINISDPTCVEPIKYETFFDFDFDKIGKYVKYSKKDFSDLIVKKYGNGEIKFKCELFSKSDFIGKVCSMLESYFDLTNLYGYFCSFYLDLFIENTRDKIAHHQVNHYEANVFIDAISAAINRYIIKDDHIVYMLKKSYKYLLKRFKKFDLRVSYYIADDDERFSNTCVTLDTCTLDKLFDPDMENELIKAFESRDFSIIRENDFSTDEKTVDDIYVSNLKEIIMLAIVHYLFKNVCYEIKHIDSDLNIDIITADIEQYYNSVSNVFYEILNKIKDTINKTNNFKEDETPAMYSISEKPYLLKSIKSDDDLTTSIEDYVSGKYASWTILNSYMLSIDRMSNNELANVKTPFADYEFQIYKPMLAHISKIYSKYYYSFYDKYVNNGFKDKSLIVITNKVIEKFYSMDIKHYTKKDSCSFDVYDICASDNLISDYNNLLIEDDTKTIYSDSTFEKIINATFFDKKNDFETKYGSNFEEFKNDVMETFKVLFTEFEKVVKYEIMFKDKVNKWCEYIMQKAKDHVDFDVSDDCKKTMCSKYSSLNPEIICELIKKHHPEVI